MVPQAEVVGVEGAKHLWVGDAETVLDLIVRAGRARRSTVPLPREWDGPMETADTSAYADRHDRGVQGRARRRASGGAPAGGRNTSLTSSRSPPRSGSRAARRRRPSSAAPTSAAITMIEPGMFDRAGHHPRVDHVVLELLVDDVEDQAGQADLRVGGEADRGDDDGAQRGPDHRDHVEQRHHDGQRHGVLAEADDEQEDQRGDPGAERHDEGAGDVAADVGEDLVAELAGPGSRRLAGASR